MNWPAQAERYIMVGFDGENLSPGEIEEYYSGNVMAARYAPEKDAKATFTTVTSRTIISIPTHRT